MKRIPNTHPKREMTMILSVCWNNHCDPSVDDPYSLRWENGEVATTDEYWRHATDTREAFLDHSGQFRLRIYPDVVGGVCWDYEKSDWKVSGDQVEIFYLKLNDPIALDSDIIAALSTFPVIYRCEIIQPAAASLRFVASPGEDGT